MVMVLAYNIHTRARIRFPKPGSRSPNSGIGEVFYKQRELCFTFYLHLAEASLLVFPNKVSDSSQYVDAFLLLKRNVSELKKTTKIT